MQKKQLPSREEGKSGLNSQESSGRGQLRGFPKENLEVGKYDSREQIVQERLVTVSFLFSQQDSLR